jgi:flagellar biosynthesis protein FlhA
MRLANLRDLVLPIAIISSIFVILIPLPVFLMDLLLAGNITVSVLILLITIYVRTPLEFSVFPTLLLATTMARLVLNVATTRLILTGAGGNDLNAAGEVIRNFGEFVAGDRLVVGIIIFAIIVIIQFVVITKGATRISEVAARFQLDGMPGRQMAIDADLNNGAIDEQEAQRRRAELGQQSDFYSAMDGAAKFVRGDAIAGIIITAINAAGGLYVGMAEMGMELADAAEVFTKLTIGDGLVSQIPAFLIAVASALLVTRSTQKINLPLEFLQQMFSRPQALYVAGGFVFLLMFTSLPKLPLMMLGGGCVGIAAMIGRRAPALAAAEQAKKEAAAKPLAPPKSAEEKIQEKLAVDPMELELGLGLIRLADPARGGDLMDRLSQLREAIAEEIGLVMPRIRVLDEMGLAENEYRIRISASPIATGRVYTDQYLALDTALTGASLPGEEVRDPAFNQRAFWIDASSRDHAEMLGFTTVEPAAVIATHLQEVVRRNADQLLGRDATKKLLDELKKHAPALVEDVTGSGVKLGLVQQVLQALLREDVPIRQLATILEAIGDHAGKTQDPLHLAEFVRHRLSRTLTSRYRDDQGQVHVVMLDPALEERIAGAIDHTDRGFFLRMSPEVVEKTNRRIREEVQKLVREGKPAILYVSPRIRLGVKELTRGDLPDLVVLGYAEVSRDAATVSRGIVRDLEA